MNNLNKIFFLSLIILGVSCKNKVSVDELNKRNGIYHYKGKPYTGYYFVTYSNGDIFEEGELKDGIHIGKTTVFYENKQIKEEENHVQFVVDNVKIKSFLDGERKGFYENGQLRFIENYKNNSIVGVRKTFYENGWEKSIDNYVNGSKEGLSKEFKVDGGQLSSFFYKNDTLHGDFFQFSKYNTEDPDSKDIKIVGKYNMGKLDGEYIVYDKQFVKLKMIMYDNGDIKFEENYDRYGKVIK